MVQDNTWFDCDDGTRLYLRRWMPELSNTEKNGKQKAVLHIVHGMAEYGGRYHRLAEKLCSCGIEVWAADQRGHGKTADLNVNDPGKGGLEGHSADDEMYELLSSDVHAINLLIRKTRPDVPVFLLGHSWGSFIAQYYIERYNDVPGSINGCILSGTRGPGGIKIRAGIHMMRIFTLLCGQRNSSSLARHIIDSPYHKPFRPNRTKFDWISRDTAEVDAYINDSFCGGLCSTGFYRELVTGLFRLHFPDAMSRINKDLPIYIFCGNADPVGDMGTSPTALINAYRSLGIKDLEFVLYPGARHETLNETNREEVMDNLLSWIDRHSGIHSGE